MSDDSLSPELLDRPNGGAMITFGWAALWLGLALIVIGAALPSTIQQYSWSDSQPNPAKWPTLYFGCILAALGLPALLTGKVIRAIYFLPGRPVTKGEVSIMNPTDS